MLLEEGVLLEGGSVIRRGGVRGGVIRRWGTRVGSQGGSYQRLG